MTRPSWRRDARVKVFFFSGGGSCHGFTPYNSNRYRTSFSTLRERCFADCGLSLSVLTRIDSSSSSRAVHSDTAASLFFSLRSVENLKMMTTGGQDVHGASIHCWTSNKPTQKDEERHLEKRPPMKTKKKKKKNHSRRPTMDGKSSLDYRRHYHHREAESTCCSRPHTKAHCEYLEKHLLLILLLVCFYSSSMNLAPLSTRRDITRIACCKGQSTNRFTVSSW